MRRYCHGKCDSYESKLNEVITSDKPIKVSSVMVYIIAQWSRVSLTHRHLGVWKNFRQIIFKVILVLDGQKVSCSIAHTTYPPVSEPDLIPAFNSSLARRGMWQ